MKKLTIFMTALIILVASTSATDTGVDVGVDIEVDEFEPQVWMNPNSRVIYDDDMEPGRRSGEGDPMWERDHNYAFEGEQIRWEILVLDKNGIEKIEEVYIGLSSSDTECNENCILEKIIGGQDAEDFDAEANCEVNHRFIDYYNAVFSAADRLIELQADITEDNAGNGDPDADPDDGGWDWHISSSSTEHSSSASPTNLYGVTALGVIGAYRLNQGNSYFTALEDVYTAQLNGYNANPTNPSIRTGFDIIELYRLYEATGDDKYKTLAENIYLAVTTQKYSSAKALAETIRDVRHTQGWDGLIPWDISAWVEAAKLLGYNNDAREMSQVIVDDLRGIPGYFDLDDKSLNAYTLGLTGAIRSFKLAGFTNIDEYQKAINLLLEMQNPDGGFQFNSIYPTPSDLQSTAYAANELFRTGYRKEGYEALDYIVSRQNANGGFEDENYVGTEYPEVDAESVTAAWGQVVNALVSTLMQASTDDFGDYNPAIMAWYTCLLTVETGDSMQGEYWTAPIVVDLDDNYAAIAEKDYWFFNPEIGLNAYGDLEFEDVIPGTDSYSSTLLLENAAEAGSGVMLDMYLAGTNFYDSDSSGAKCPDSNVLELENFRYYATHGAYDSNDYPTFGDYPADSEGYMGIPLGNKISDGKEILGNEMYGEANFGYPWWVGNVLSPGDEMALTFKLSLPEPCNGNFDTGTFYFWGEAM